MVFYYKEILVVNIKGLDRKYTTLLFLLTGIDLSRNIHGDFLWELTKLAGLIILNLNRNHISGQIPESISNLQQLSSLDLSSNNLFGPIPPSMLALDSLGFLNLSNNNFFGAIPYTGHITTFQASSYAGNPELWGGPLAKNCFKWSIWSRENQWEW